MILVDRIEHPVGTEDFATLFNSVVAGSPRLVQVFGDHEVLSSLNLTSKRHGMTVDFTGAKLTARMRGGVVVDMTHSTGVNILGLRLVAVAHPSKDEDQPKFPDVGLLQSRTMIMRGELPEPAWPAAGKHRFDRIQIDGPYGIAAVYSIGAENSVWIAPRLDNDNPDGVAALYLTRRNVHRVTSAHGVHPQNGPPDDGKGESTSGQVFYGLHAVCKVNDGNGKGSVVINGHGMATFYGPYIASKDAPHILVDCSTESVVGPEVHELFAHPAGGDKPEAAIQIKGLFNHGVAGTRILARQLSAKKYAVRIGENDLLNCDFDWLDPLAVEIHRDARLVGCAFRRREERFVIRRRRF